MADNSGRAGMAKETGPFEIPGDIRTAAERGIEQARVAFDRFMDSAKTGMDAVEHRSKAAQDSARDIRTTVVSFAEQHMANTFEYVQKSMAAKDPQELMQLQIDFMRAQMEGLSQQAKMLGDTVTRAATDLTSKK
jgi:phasin